MNFVIKYGISPQYVPQWGFKEAYREIIQNFLDYGDYNLQDNGDSIELSNLFVPDDFNFLKIGFTSKSDGKSRGRWGEGIKMSLLVLKRLNIKCQITFKNYIIKPMYYEDEYLGNCFGISVEDLSESTFDNFSITFDKPENFDEEFSDFVLKEDDTIFDSGYNGKIVNKPKGSIYVGGLFVAKLENLSYAYDLNPSTINLGRDRSIPQTYDVEWHCSKINGLYIERENKDISEVDFNNRDFSYIDSISDKIIDDIIPVCEDEIESDDEIQFESTKTGQRICGYNLVNTIKSHPKMKEKIEKVKVRVKEKLTPHLIIKTFNEKYNHHLPEAGKEELNTIQYKANDWYFD